MADLDHEKKLAALAAVEEVRDGMRVGLGTGSSAKYAIEAIGARMKDGLRIEAVATSSRSEELARALGIRLLSFSEVARVDLAIDGADEVDPALAVIKGGGGALFLEKIVAQMAERFLVIVDSTKLVTRLGRFKLPIEVLPASAAWVRRAVTRLGVEPQQRALADGKPFLTDQGNFILDLPFGQIADARRLSSQLREIAGVVEHGLFLDEVDAVFVGRGGTVERLDRPRSP